MKNLLLIFILASLIFQANKLKAQIDTNEIIYSKLDTVYYYKVNTRSQILGSSEKYWVNNKVVSKQTYDKYRNNFSKMSNCRPCYLMSLDINGKLKREAVQYTDCFVGKIPHVIYR